MEISNSTLYLVDDRDYIYQGYQKVDPPSKSYDNQSISYYQPEVHNLSCSLHAAMTVVSNHTGYIFSLNERKDIFGIALQRGFDTSFGWYMNKAVKCVVDYCNSECDMDLVYIRVHWTQYLELAKKGFGIVCGYKQRAGMGTDRSNDGILGNEGKTYGSMAYGHLVSFWEYKKRKNQKKVVSDSNPKKGLFQFGLVDNYFPKHATNETFIDNLENLVKQDTIFPNGYIIVERKKTKLKTLEEFKQKIKDFRKIIN